MSQSSIFNIINNNINNKYDKFHRPWLLVNEIVANKSQCIKHFPYEKSLNVWKCVESYNSQWQCNFNGVEYEININSLRTYSLLYRYLK